MKLRSLTCTIVVAGLPCLASAESLRCHGSMVSEGDSRLSVVYKCGQPQLADTFCAPVYYPGTLEVVPQPFASTIVPCQLVEAWLYERGPGNFVATVYIRSGVVQSIIYGHDPR